jgi:hypothetical protein
LHCFYYSLNPKYYSNDWLNGRPSHRFSPHMDGEISQGRKDAFRRIYQDRASFDEVEDGFVEFPLALGNLEAMMCSKTRGVKNPYAWWATHGATCPLL